jgi:long-chain fatty acid transport protein
MGYGANKKIEALVWGLVSIASFLVSSTTWAGALYLIEAGASPRNGVVVAGSAAYGEDATASYYNAAGMSNLDGAHFVMGGGLAAVSTRFSADGGTSPGLESGGNGGQAGGIFPIFAGFFVYDPSRHFEGEWADRVRFGISSVTLAASLNYDSGWAGRYLNSEVSILAPSVNPVASYRIADWLSIGGGLNLEYMLFDLKIALPNPTVPPSTTAPPDGELDLSLHDFTVGGNLGVQLTPMEAMTLGLIWFSERKHDLSGDSDFTNLVPPLDSLLRGDNVGLNFDLAQTLTASIQYRLGNNKTSKKSKNAITLLGSVGWEDWSVMQYNVLENDSDHDVSIPRKMRDTWNIAAGVEWQVAEEWLVQTGMRYDSSPYGDSGVRLPDMPFDQQFHASLGVVHDWSEQASLALSLAYVNLGKSGIDAANAAGTLSGDYSTNQAWFLTVAIDLH